MSGEPVVQQVEAKTQTRLDRGLGLATIFGLATAALLILGVLAMGVFSPPAPQAQRDEPYLDYFQRHRPAVVPPEPYVDYPLRHPPAVVAPEPYRDYGQRHPSHVATPEPYPDYGQRHAPAATDAP